MEATELSDPGSPSLVRNGIGAGWAFRPAEPLGLQLLGAQHVRRSADGGGGVEDVMGNIWSLAVAIR